MERSSSGFEFGSSGISDDTLERILEALQQRPQVSASQPSGHLAQLLGQIGGGAGGMAGAAGGMGGISSMIPMLAGATMKGAGKAAGELDVGARAGSALQGLGAMIRGLPTPKPQSFDRFQRFGEGVGGGLAQMLGGAGQAAGQAAGQPKKPFQGPVESSMDQQFETPQMYKPVPSEDPTQQRRRRGLAPSIY